MQERKTLLLDPGNLGVDVDPADVDHYTELAAQGLISVKGCNGPAVQDDLAFRTRSTVELS
ncbi:hypothetical protein GCM10023196_036690 [Actinoallomurus vinaceus]|uniref:Uncharacterized protein n=1 Tax=Actinoallomurus vinaceus TaxID=1080074 RepID=A0ABP8UAN3_9ACTN